GGAPGTPRPAVGRGVGGEGLMRAQGNLDGSVDVTARGDPGHAPGSDRGADPVEDAAGPQSLPSVLVVAPASSVLCCLHSGGGLASSFAARGLAGGSAGGGPGSGEGGVDRTV